MSGKYEGHQGGQVNKLMAIWLCLEREVCMNCLRLVIKSPFDVEV